MRITRCAREQVENTAPDTRFFQQFFQISNRTENFQERKTGISLSEVCLLTGGFNRLASRLGRYQNERPAGGKGYQPGIKWGVVIVYAVITYLHNSRFI